MTTTANPYGATQTPLDDQYIDPAYAAPEELGPYGLPSTPYAVKLDEHIGGTPDPQREQDAPTRSYRINPDQPRALWSQLDQDRAERNSVTSVRQQIHERVEPESLLGANRWARRAGEIPPPPERTTADLAPTNYSYTRPFQGGTPHRFTGEHFSLADHRRSEPVLYGVMPQRTRRTTQRLDLVPWGTNVVDQAPQTIYPNENYTNTVQSPLANGGAYRLG